MAQLTCPCGTRFEAESPRARYCSGKCRKRGSRAGMKVAQNVRQMPRREPAPAPEEIGSVVGAVIAELNEANALQTAAGLAAVKLAQLIDGASDFGSTSAAAWTREMRAALADAKAVAPTSEEDPLRSLEAARAKRRA